MDAIRLDDGDWRLSDLVERVEAGESFEIVRGERVVATLAPGGPARPEPSAPHPSWREAGIDWDEIRRFAATLPYDPTNSVVEMRKLARY